MRHISITGASSFIGRHLLARLLLHHNLHLRLLINSTETIPLPESSEVTIVRGNLLDWKSLDGLAAEDGIVVNLAYLRDRSPAENIAAVSNLIDICSKARIRRFIHCSTAVVSGRVAARRVTESTSCHPLNVYEVTKGRIEKLILEKTEGLFETVIVRPTAVFGEGGINLASLAGSLMKGSMLKNYLKSCVYQYRRMHLVPVDTVVSAIEFLMTTDRDINSQIYIVSDDEDPANSYREVEKYLMMRLGCRDYPVAPVSLPFPILKFLLRIAGRTNDNPELVYDCRKICALGFQKPLCFKEGLARFSDWYVKTQSPSMNHP